ncbi:glycoside hydrolase family 3 C-terminal domain-containing protein [Nocardioides endophyticus]|uniref:Glycoside hydrolase family 3 C-terminal domain-containing protein n=1 Tax=Nocardioides endophyticus TaxID=1353775 RepID=A0ABP8ZD47_9ACTN
MNRVGIWTAGLVVAVAAAATLAPAGATAVGGEDGPGGDQRSRFSGDRSQPQWVAQRPDARSYRTDNWDTSSRVERRVDELMAQLTTQEKADLATGELNNNYGFFNNAIARLDIPASTMADGPVGVRVANPNIDKSSTQLPSASALAASFGNGMARRWGRLLGQEAFDTGHNFQLAPSADIARTPLWGRAFEGFGEDPLLVGNLSAAVVAGIQDHPVVATAKHPFAYNQETDRFNVNAVVGERALQEIYLRPFDIVQRDGRPGAMMCSFNKLNGTYACENDAMTTLLKEQLGFRGFIMSDYNATPSTVQAANAGLDQEQPGDQGLGSANFGERLVAAVAAGDVSMSRLDDMARRILRPMVGLGLFDERPVVTAWDKARNSRFARRVAARGIVLLKNNRSLLPLRARSGSIAVIGPDADNTSAQGGGSSQISVPTAAVDTVSAIRARAGAGNVTYSPGTDGISEGDLLPGPAPVPSSVLTPEGGSGTGLSASYWGNATYAGDPHLVQEEPNANVDFGFQNFPGFNAASPKIPTVRGDFALLGDLSARWRGTLTAPATGWYTLGLTARGDATLAVDGAKIVTHSGALSSAGRRLFLQSGTVHQVAIDYAAPALNSYQGAQVRFWWQHPESVLSPAMRAAVDAAAAADTAVVVVRDYETEGVDRPDLGLPKEQEQLIRQVAAVNPRTVVVIMTGATTTVRTWGGSARAILQAWYPGQEQGNAVANVLFGRTNPSGRLPATVPRSERQVPIPNEGTERYDEGVYVGYRGFLADRVQPSYPFGYGLSYTTFRLSRAQVLNGSGNGDNVRVRFRVTNTGNRAGAMVPQVYVGELPGVDSPPRQLAGYARVQLARGASRTITVKIPTESLSYWDTDADRWETPEGNTAVYLGRSSAANRQIGQATVR